MVLTQPGQPVMVQVPGAEESRLFSPASKWSHGGPIIERELINTSAIWQYGRDAGNYCTGVWQAIKNLDGNFTVMKGRMPLEAAMRLYVFSIFGDAVPESADSAPAMRLTARVVFDGGELVASLSDRRVLRHHDSVMLADMLLAAGVTAKNVMLIPGEHEDGSSGKGSLVLLRRMHRPGADPMEDD